MTRGNNGDIWLDMTVEYSIKSLNCLENLEECSLRLYTMTVPGREEWSETVKTAGEERGQDRTECSFQVFIPTTDQQEWGPLLTTSFTSLRAGSHTSQQLDHQPLPASGQSSRLPASRTWPGSSAPLGWGWPSTLSLNYFGLLPFQWHMMASV